MAFNVLIPVLVTEMRKVKPSIRSMKVLVRHHCCICWYVTDAATAMMGLKYTLSKQGWILVKRVRCPSLKFTTVDRAASWAEVKTKAVSSRTRGSVGHHPRRVPGGWPQRGRRAGVSTLMWRSERGMCQLQKPILQKLLEC